MAMKISNSLKKYLLITIGFVSLALGTVGVFLPILPTTPFLLLTAYCFMRTSERLYKWLINNKLVGRYILDYIKYGAISKKNKIIALVSLWGMIGLSAYMTDKIYIKWLLMLVALAVSWHIVSLRTRVYEQSDIKKAAVRNLTR